MSDDQAAVLELVDVEKVYRVRAPGTHSVIRALNGVTLGIRSGETLAVVGESGCGKTTLARVALRLISPSSGLVLFQGRDITSLPGRSLRDYRRQVQAVFQDPYDSLDPRFTARRIVMEPLQARGWDRGRAMAAAEAALEAVGIPRRMALRHPHEFSGGQRQRLGIARAMVGEPSLVVLDEPTSALDVTVQAQVVDLLLGLQATRDLTYLFISHDLALVRHFASRVAVMYLGSVVETAPTAEIFAAPHHPYTIALLSAVPIPDPVRQKARPRLALEGELSTVGAQRSGCSFAPRCWLADDRCRIERPELLERDAGHRAACHKVDLAVAAYRGELL